MQGNGLNSLPWNLRVTLTVTDYLPKWESTSGIRKLSGENSEFNDTKKYVNTNLLTKQRKLTMQSKKQIVQ